MIEFWKKYNNLFALLLSLFAGFLLVAVVEGIGHAMYPPPEKLDYTDQDAMRSFLATAPFGSLLMVVISYCLGVGVGAFCATYFADVSKKWPLYIFFVVFFISLVANFVMIPFHPLWMILASLLGVLAFTALGFNLAQAQKRKKMSS